MVIQSCTGRYMLRSAAAKAVSQDDGLAVWLLLQPLSVTDGYRRRRSAFVAEQCITATAGTMLPMEPPYRSSRIRVAAGCAPMDRQGPAEIQEPQPWG